ncbi:hypothetical protein COMNV_00451 [Commensalibacter sp. Nvir]|uniref:PBSX family phage terminase large subunit n=1 Tax=Commensalibacter sp. Nvir TaxID=3069817 RepID=UPI002D3AD065|nr:hypothetical protein COMNV_00451 [Commensalibacter sp. Nvir]
MIISDVFAPIITKATRYKVLYGGRGSGKSTTVAFFLIQYARRAKFNILCGREIQKSIKDSVYQLLKSIIEKEGLTAEFEFQNNYIFHKRTRSQFMFRGLKSNITAIQSLEGVNILWIEEAQSVSKESWDVLIPTIRTPNSEIWMTFNPKNILDETYQRFVLKPPEHSVVLNVNFDQNPYFPDVLRDEMEACKTRDYDLYRHIWLGEPRADSEQAIIKPMWIDAAKDAHLMLGFNPAGEKTIGFDVADEGADANALCYRHGAVVQDLFSWKEGDIGYSSSKVYAYAMDHQIRTIVYDSIGVGAGVKSHLRRYQGLNAAGFNAGGKVERPTSAYRDGKTNEDMFLNLKAQTWWKVRDRFEFTYRLIQQKHAGEDVHITPAMEDSLISISSQIKELDYLCAELSRPQVDYTENGKVKVESKKDLKKRGIPSPNLADAFVMAFYTKPRGFF